MKDKTLYWILGIIAAYFVVRFIMNQIAVLACSNPDCPSKKW